MRKKFLAVAMSAVLAVSLCPGLAMANSFTGGGATLDSGSATKTVAGKGGKKAVFVLVGVSHTNTYSYNEREQVYDENGNPVYDADGNPVYETRPVKETNVYNTTYSHNGQGLVSTQGYSNNYDHNGSKSSSKGTRYKLSYSGANLKKVNAVSYGESYTFKSKGGFVVGATYKSPSGSSKTTYSYTRNGKGQLTNSKYTSYSKYVNGKTYKKLKKSGSGYSKYTLKGGKPVKVQSGSTYSDGSSYTSAPTKYAYDGKGNIKKVKSTYSTTTYVSKYSGKQLKSRKAKGSSITYTFKFAKKKVPASAVAAVNAQQWALLNSNMNCAFGPVGIAASN